MNDNANCAVIPIRRCDDCEDPKRLACVTLVWDEGQDLFLCGSHVIMRGLALVLSQSRARYAVGQVLRAGTEPDDDEVPS